MGIRYHVYQDYSRMVISNRYCGIGRPQGSRRPPRGWSLSETMKTCDTVMPAWKMAIKNRPIVTPLIFHSDRGVQYACHEFRNVLKVHPLVVQSMSRKGNCWDNAVAESFFKTLKAELIYIAEPTTIAETKVNVFEFIEIWYNGTGHPAEKNARIPRVSNPRRVRSKTESKPSQKCGLTFCPLFPCKFKLRCILVLS